MRSHQAEVDKYGVGENGALGNETGGHEPHMDFHWSPSASAAAAAKIAKPPANESEAEKPGAKDPAVEAAEKVEAYDDKIHHEAADEPEKHDVNATAAAAAAAAPDPTPAPAAAVNATASSTDVNATAA